MMNKSALFSGSSCQDISENTVAGIESPGKAVRHVESLALAACRLQERRVQRVNWSLSVNLCETASLKGTVKVAKEHHRPVCPIGMLFVCVVAGVDDEGVVHH